MIAFDDDADLIDIGLLLFAEGGMFALENEVLHHAEDELPPVWGGSRKGRAPNINRERVKYAHLLDEDFWGETPQITNSSSSGANTPRITSEWESEIK